MILQLAKRRRRIKTNFVKSRIFILPLMAMIGLICGCSSDKPQVTQIVVKPKVAGEPVRPVAAAPVTNAVAAILVAPAPAPDTAAKMLALAKRIAAGDPAAFGELGDTAKKLYQGIDFEKERDRAMSNLVLMRAAFTELGEQAGQGNTNAFAALKRALGVAELRSFAPDALGIAAAAGRAEALNMLLNYKQWGILKSSAVFALWAPAEKNSEPAVDFLVAVLNEPNDRALWQGASQGLAAAANQGNLKAKTALEKYAAAH
jgi:hypothetical protein